MFLLFDALDIDLLQHLCQQKRYCWDFAFMFEKQTVTGELAQLDAVRAVELHKMS